MKAHPALIQYNGKGIVQGVLMGRRMGTVEKEKLRDGISQ